MYFFRTAIVLFLFTTLLVQCQGNSGTKAIGKNTDSSASISVTDTLIEQIPHPLSGIVFDSAAIPGFLARYPEFKEFSNDIIAFYRNRFFNYAWFGKEGLIEPTQILLDRLNQEKIDGITLNTPYNDQLETMFHFGDQGEPGEQMKPEPNAELMLTGQYLRLAKKIWAGAYSKNLETIGWNIPRKKISYQELLDKSLDIKNLPNIMHEILNPEYLALRSALKQYYEIEKKSTDPFSIAKVEEITKTRGYFISFAPGAAKAPPVWLPR